MNPHSLVFHHIGIACSSIATEEKNFSSLGYTREGETFFDPLQKISGFFMTLGPMRIELLEPTSNDSPLGGFIQRKVKMYHQAFFCDNLPRTIQSLVQEGAHITVTPVPSVAFNGRKISFLMLRNMLLVELIESSR